MYKKFQIKILCLLCWLSLCLLASPLQAGLADRLDAASFNTIYQSALLANASYHDTKQIQQLLEQGYTLDKSIVLRGYEVACFLATRESSGEQLAIFRGTSNIENALVDAAFEFVEDEHIGIKLHQGFALSSALAYEELKPYLNKNYTLHTTGHSLGGAIALIFAMHAHTDDYRTGHIITFGQPKVTNVTGSHHFSHLDVTRVVMPRDMVPLVPPLDPMSIDPMNLLEMDIYWHQGTELVLQDANQYSLLKGVKSVMRATDFLVDKLSEDNLNQHMMDQYLRTLSKKLKTPEAIPYSNDFSLFKLFGY